MQVNLIIPICIVPQHSLPQQIIQAVAKLTGFQKFEFFHLQSLQQRQGSGSLKQVCVGASDFGLDMWKISEICSKVEELQRQNNLLKQDLAKLYSLSNSSIPQNESEIHKKQQEQVSPQQNQEFQAEQQSQQESNHKKTTDVIPNQQKQNYEIKSLHKQIKNLISDKLSKQEIISKLTIYCQYLLKIIQNKKISVF